MAWCSGLPVRRFHSSVVSRWLVMPMARMSAAVSPALAMASLRGGQLRGPDLHRVVLDPAGLRKVLRQLALRLRDDAALRIEDDAARAGRALVQREDVAHRVSCEPPVVAGAVFMQVNLTDIRAAAGTSGVSARRWT